MQLTCKIVDQIYEAAFVPELWPHALDKISEVAGSVGGAVLVAGDRHPPRWAASEIVALALKEYTSSEAWKNNKRPQQFISAGHRGFTRDVDVFAAEELERDRVTDKRQKHGLGWQIGTIIPMPTGEVAIFTFDRLLTHGPHELPMRDAASSFFPHLARAGLLAARLGLERAQTAIATLDALGLPAAATTATGHVVASNKLFDDFGVFLPAAHGAVVLSNAEANVLLQDAFSAVAADPAFSRSILIPANEDKPPAILHALPLPGAAHDVFSGAVTLLVVTELMSERLPDLTLLHGLFDLTPAEAKLAAALSSGRTLKIAAMEQNIRESTARSYLEIIFRKTGVRQQSQLVALLNGTRRMIP